MSTHQINRPRAAVYRLEHEQVTSFRLATLLATISWIIPRLLPSVDIDFRSVSMASWLVLPSSDSPFTAINWSLTRSRPSCCGDKKNDTIVVLE